MFYIFGLWIALAVLAGAISRYLRPSETEDGSRDPGDI